MTNADASTLMKRGIALLNENTPASLAEAIALFDQALAIRTAALVAGDHWLAYLTAASWMNRGDALTRLAEPARIADAVRSYDEALALMRAVPLEIDPLYRRRLAIAWMNRGISLQQQGTAEDFAAAVDSFDEAIAVLRGHLEHAPLLAAGWMNRGSALLRLAPPRATEARALAASALELLVKIEEEDLLAAETALKARYLICQANAELLATKPAPHDVAELAADATDAVEDGMRLALHWEERGEMRFRSLAEDFFRFGVAAYRLHQPHFLAEFISEHLSQAAFASDVELHHLAIEALTAAARDLQTEGFAAIRTPRFDGLLETLRVLQITQSRRDALRGRDMDSL